jgi:hypothetical protein
MSRSSFASRRRKNKRTVVAPRFEIEHHAWRGIQNLMRDTLRKMERIDKAAKGGNQ